MTVAHLSEICNWKFLEKQGKKTWLYREVNAKIKTQEFADKELQTVKMATLYELRLMLTNSAKEQYTTEELVEPFDRIAAEKEF